MANCNLSVNGCKARGRVGGVDAEQIPSSGPEKNPHLSTTSEGSFQLNPSLRTG